MKEKIELNKSNQLDKNYSIRRTGLFYGWKLSELAFNIQIIMTIVIFFYCWQWLNINFFLSIPISIVIAFLLVIFLDISIFRVLFRKVRGKKD